jgi:hypothetical protein
MLYNESRLSFVNILKYSYYKEKTALENYTTELFVFLLNYLSSTKNKIIFEILNEFGFVNTVKLEKINIYTQGEFYVGKKLVKPDIILEYNKKKIIIEVKVDSNLNQYVLNKKNMNQLELYSNIEGVTSVYLLTKKVILIDSIKNEKIKGRIFWSKIYNLLEHSNDFVIKSFNYFLEENGMKTSKLDKNIFSALDSLSTLSSLIEQSWNYTDYPLSAFSYSKKGWFGCYVKNKKNKKNNLLWLGLAGDELLVHFTNKKTEKRYLDDGNELRDGSLDVIKIKELIEINSPEEQKEYLTKWFIKIMDKKLKKYLV